MWIFVGFLSAFAAVCGACLAGQDQHYSALGAIVVFVGLGMTFIALVATYGEGHDTGVGKPKTEAHMKPGTRYAHIHNFVEVSADGSQQHVALLQNLNENVAEFCVLRHPLPAAQMVAAMGDDGEMHLQRSPIDVLA